MDLVIFKPAGFGSPPGRTQSDRPFARGGQRIRETGAPLILRGAPAPPPLCDGVQHDLEDIRRPRRWRDRSTLHACHASRRGTVTIPHHDPVRERLRQRTSAKQLLVRHCHTPRDSRLRFHTRSPRTSGRRGASGRRRCKYRRRATRSSPTQGRSSSSVVRVRSAEGRVEELALDGDRHAGAGERDHDRRRDAGLGKQIDPCRDAAGEAATGEREEGYQPSSHGRRTSSPRPRPSPSRRRRRSTSRTSRASGRASSSL